MDLRQLKYFARIVELESMTAAAQSLYVAQPSLSQHIANLEQSVGVKLLHRSVQGTRPTPAGDLLYRYAKSILRQADEASAALKQGLAAPAERVSVGLPTSTLHMVGEALVRKVRATHGASITLEITESATATLAEKLGRQGFDIAIVPDSRSGANYDAQPLLVEELLAYGPADAGTGPAMTLASLTRHPLVLPAFPNSVRVRIENACLEKNLSYSVGVESASAALMVQLARSGFGWTVLPWAAAQGLDIQLHPVAISDVRLTRTLSLCVCKAALDNPTCDLIRSYIVDIVKEKVRAGAWPHTKLWQDDSQTPKAAV